MIYAHQLKLSELTQRLLYMVPPQWKWPFLYIATIYGQLCGVERSPPTMRKYSLRLFRSFSSRTRRTGAFIINLFVVPHFNSGHFTNVWIWVRLCGSIGHVSENRICCEICVFCEIFEMYGPGRAPNVPWISGNLLRKLNFFSYFYFNSIRFTHISNEKWNLMWNILGKFIHFSFTSFNSPIHGIFTNRIPSASEISI